ncbi:DUF4350 domain-containing protein [Cellulomonas carbonis]|nr:DUF4350 domain-containing protein [Cellulomonas carbonis]GGC11551.1 hypothetical protein GCM10010972_26080 [Cellulomonas carbonis]
MSAPTTAGRPVPPTGTPATVAPDVAPGAVLGDGTTARGRARSRWRRARWPLVVLLGVLVAAALASVLEPRTSTDPLGHDNPEADGARAVAQVLTGQGVTITPVSTTADAARAAGPGVTLLVSSTWYLSDEQVERVRGTGADLVVVSPDDWHVPVLTGGAVDVVWSASTTVEPRCDDPAARAAGTLTTSGGPYVAVTDAASVCFTGSDGAGGVASATVDGARVTLVSDGSVLTNRYVADEGNAALALHLLGRNDELVWYLPSATDTGESATDPFALLPPWVGPVAAQLGLVLAVVALWRARRLGRLVTEPLPVTVRAAEATEGRARLYRRARSRGHAAAALRAGTARRAAGRLGLPRSAGATDVVDAVARATRRPAEQVTALLYGPPPTDDAGLLRLARQLDELESEVHRT